MQHDSVVDLSTLETTPKLSPGSTKQMQSPFNAMAIRDVTVGGKNSVYSLTFGGHIYRLDNSNNWTLIPTGKVGFKDISCTERGSLFAIGGHDSFLYQLIEGDFVKVNIDHNMQITSISAVSAKKVFAIGNDRMPLKLDIKYGTDAKTLKRPTWERIGNQPLLKISAGSKKVFKKMVIWGMGEDNFPYRYDPQQRTWIKSADIQIRDISVSKDNIVYIVTQDGLLMKWVGRKFGRIEKCTTKCKETFISNISAYKESKYIFAVDGRTGHIIKLNSV
jgi:hypothetical protein